MSGFTWTERSARELGVNGVSLADSTDMEPMAVQGADQLELTITILNVTGAAIVLTGTLQKREDGNGEWETMTTVTIASGVETISLRSIKHTIAAVAATYRFNHTISDPKWGQFRIAALTGAAAGATDLLTISARARIIR